VLTVRDVENTHVKMRESEKLRFNDGHGRISCGPKKSATFGASGAGVAARKHAQWRDVGGIPKVRLKGEARKKGAKNSP